MSATVLKTPEITEPELSRFLDTHYRAIFLRLRGYIEGHLGETARRAQSLRDVFHEALAVMLTKCPIRGMSLSMDSVCGYVARVIRNLTANLRRLESRRRKRLQELFTLARNMVAVLLGVLVVWCTYVATENSVTRKWIDSQPDIGTPAFLPEVLQPERSTNRANQRLALDPDPPVSGQLLTLAYDFNALSLDATHVRVTFQPGTEQATEHSLNAAYPSVSVQVPTEAELVVVEDLDGPSPDLVRILR